MKEWWQKIATRERYLIIGGGICVLLFLMFQFVYKPLDQGIDNLQINNTEQQALLDWMKTTVPQILTLQGQATTSSTRVSNGAILTTAAQTFDAFKLKSSAIEEVSPQKITVKMDKIDFDDLFRCLIQLWEKNGIEVTDIVITPIKKSGMVRAEITLESGK